jgi:hypothetical protein
MYLLLESSIELRGQCFVVPIDLCSQNLEFCLVGCCRRSLSQLADVVFRLPGVVAIVEGFFHRIEKSSVVLEDRLGSSLLLSRRVLEEVFEMQMDLVVCGASQVGDHVEDLLAVVGKLASSHLDSQHALYVEHLETVASSEELLRCVDLDAGGFSSRGIDN